MSKLINNDKLPFIIGVTGHRLLPSGEQLGTLRGDFRQALLYWRNKVEKHTPIWLLSGFAQGADLLAIDVVEELIQELSWDENFVKVVPCLAMPYEAMLIDFEGSNECPPEFGRDALVEKYARYRPNCIVVPHGLLDDDYRSALKDRQYGLARNQLYLNQGAFLAKYCNVVIAMWDGLASRGLGGTADVVRLKCAETKGLDLSGVPEEILPFDEFEGGPLGVVHYIHTPTFGEAENRSSILSEFHVVDSNLFPRQKLLGAITHAVSTEQGHDEKITTREARLLQQQIELFNLNACEYQNENPINKSEGSSNKVFDVADNSAIYFQSRYKKRLVTFYVSVVFTFLSYELFTFTVGSILGIVMNILVLLILLWVMFLRERAGKVLYKSKYQLARCIAEALRIKDSLNQVSDSAHAELYISREQRLRLPVLLQTLSYSDLFNQWKISHADNGKDFNAARTDWLDEQIAFFESRLQISGRIKWKLVSSKKPKQAYQTLSKYPSKCLGYAALFGGLHLLTQGPFLHGHPYLDTIQSIMLFTIQMLLMTSGAAAFWLEYNNYQSNYKNYESLLVLFKRAKAWISDSCESESKKVLVMQKLASEAMREHTAWYFTERSNDMKLNRLRKSVKLH
ncbi:hypothetical protein [Thalassotalea mangrovi]|uniref:DUF4231 domain-containing protein n=1 Tax=Thalassotalea mangrovi TaxID=2572245 RepID=A0A4U1B6I6_9GAMM|nr:hypothetical protein [Thalassotalea mangrovi]TKB46125.1 hypothetical protein E8M12_05725 [Thalassotalea mangrovi]